MFNHRLRYVASLFMFCVSSLHAETIEIWSGLEHETAHMIKQRVEQATEHKLEVRSFDIHDLRAELLVARPDESYYPDAVWVPSDFLGLGAHIEYETIPSDWIQDFQLEQKALEAVTVQGDIKAIPFAIGNQLMLYARKSQQVTKSVNWEMLIYVAEMQNNPSIAFANPNVYLSVAFYTLFSENSLAGLNLNGSSVVKSIRFVDQLLQQNVVKSNCGPECSRDLFIKGEVNYLIDGDWAYNQLSQELGEDLEILPLPTFNSKTMTSFSGAKVLAATPKGRSSDAKWQLLKQLIYGIAERSADVNQADGTVISPYAGVNDRLLHSGNDDFKKLYAAFEQSQMMPSSVKMGIVWEALGRAQRRFHAGMPDDELAVFYEQFVSSNLEKVQLGFE